MKVMRGLIPKLETLVEFSRSRKMEMVITSFKAQVFLEEEQSIEKASDFLLIYMRDWMLIKTNFTIFY